MLSVNSLIHAIDERTIAQQIAIPHDEARVGYHLRTNTVGSFDEFVRVITDYYHHHFSRCVAHGGRLSTSEASSRAKEILEREYRRRNGDIVSAYNDAHDGTNGGLRAVLDAIAEGLKAASVENYIRDVFDRHVAPNAWEDKVEIIRQFIHECGAHLSSSIHRNQPERYAQNYVDLIHSYVGALQETSSLFRRL